MKTQLFVLGVLMAAFPLVSTFGLSLPVSTDTFTTMKANVAVVTATSGKATTLAVTPTQDALVFFDLNGLPPAFSAANVIGARLRFYMAKVIKPGDLAIHRALDPWDEDKDGPAPGTDATPIATVLAGKIASKRFVVVDVTPTVKAWLAMPTSNNGLAIIAAGASPTLKASLGAKEGPGVGQPAELEIEVNPAGGVYQNADPATGKLDGQQIATSTIGNSQLANPSFTLNAGTGLSGGGGVALGGMVTLNNSGVTSLAGGGGITVSAANGGVALSSNATTANIPDTIVKRDGNGNINVASTPSFTGTLNGDVTGTQGATVVETVGGDSATNVASGANAAINATNTSTANTIVRRDASGNFAAGSIVATSFSGGFNGTADADLQGNILKNSALGMLLYHATLPAATEGGGSFNSVDGVAMILSNGGPGAHEEAAGGNFITIPINKTGTFVSARAGWFGTPVAGNVFYVVVGRTGGPSAPSAGFGFRADGAALKGVTIDDSNGQTTTIDLATNLSSGAVNLLAVRRANSVEFFVNGVSKGSSSTNLPGSAASYVVRVENTVPQSTATMVVGFVTIGIPMF